MDSGNSEISIKRASIITALSRYAVVIINLLITFLLARILSPEEFGVVSVVTVFTAFFTMLSDFGISRTVIQDRDLTNDELSGIYTVNFGISVVITLLFLPFSYLLSIVYGDSTYLYFAPLLSIALFFSSMVSIPNALCLRDKSFLGVGISGLLAAIAGGIVAVGTSLAGAGAYALVMQSVVSAIIAEVSQEYLARRKWRIHIDLRPNTDAVKRSLGYSMGQFGFNVVNYFARNLDNLIIGKLMGARSLGLYDKAYKLTVFPVNYLTAVISSALHPLLAEYQQDKDYIYEKYVSVVKFLSLAGAFITPFCCFSSREIILFAFGDAWMESILPFSLLSVSIWFQMTASSCGAIYLSTGQTETMLKSCLIFVPIQIVCIVAGVLTGNIAGCAATVSFSYIIKFTIEYWFLIYKVLERSYIAFLKMLLPDIITGVCVSLPLIALNYLEISVFLHPAITLLLHLVVAFAVYILSLKILKQGDYVLNVLPNGIASKFSWLGSNC